MRGFVFCSLFIKGPELFWMSNVFCQGQFLSVAFCVEVKLRFFEDFLFFPLSPSFSRSSDVPSLVSC